MNFKLDVINIVILLVMLINSMYGFIIYFRNKTDRTNQLFFILTITISSWGLSMFFYRGFLDYSMVLLMSRLLYFTAITIPIAFIYFVMSFSNQIIKTNFYRGCLIPVMPVLLCILSLYPGGFIYDVILYKNKETFIVFNQLTHILFGIYVVGYFLWAYSILFKKFTVADEIFKTQIFYILIGTFISTTLTLITNLSLLYFGYFELNWVGQVGIIFMITLIFYSILKFKLFNIRIILVEAATFILWTLMLIRVILSKDLHSLLVESGLFIIVVILGIILIRSVLQNLKQREEIDKLTKGLQEAYAHIYDAKNSKKP